MCRYLLDHLELGAQTGWISPLVPEEPIPPLTRPRTVPVSLQSRFYDEKMGKHQISPGCRGSQNSVRRDSIPRGVPEHPSKFQRLTPADNGENRHFRGRERSYRAPTDLLWPVFHRKVAVMKTGPRRVVTQENPEMHHWNLGLGNFSKEPRSASRNRYPSRPLLVL